MIIQITIHLALSEPLTFNTEEELINEVILSQDLIYLSLKLILVHPSQNP